MNTTEKMLPQSLFSRELIWKQADKIFASNPFSTSPILRNFLQFILDEYAAGRSEQIKEYTIATQVMKRPFGFSPQTDGIVRIHARRLRLALENYYQGAGSQDELFISIPKGRYMPFFGLFHSPEIRKEKKWPALKKESTRKLAVLPFKTFEVGIESLAFSDSLGEKLSHEIGKSSVISVMSYHLVRELNPKNRTIDSLWATYSTQFAITGNVQFENQKMRVSVQLINCFDQTQIWSEIYHLDFSSDHFFELTDILTARMIDVLFNPETAAGNYLAGAGTTKRRQAVI